MKHLLKVFLLCLLLGTASAGEYKIELVADGLSYPWAIAFLPDGDMLVTERSGQLRRISNGKLQQQAIGNLPDMFVGGQGGLMDIILDPDFALNQRLYISLSTGTKSANSTRVISARLIENTLKDINIIFTASTSKDTPHHFGGRLAFLPDQTLLITVGEGFDYREKAQSLDNHFGKLIRINKDGTIPSDNPFIGREGALPEIWSYGHRNPQGLLVSADGTVWLHEHGPRGGDELNIIEPGNNYGWPAISFGMDYSGAYVTPYTEAPGMQQPVIHWTPSIAPSGFCEYTGAVFENWKGNLFVATLAEKSVRRLVMQGGKVASQEILFTELDQRIREVRASADGYLYLLTDSEDGQLLRVSPSVN
ncbi:MAG: PQQ-dependent sugar dehydrogenase [Proteobacteria bacterium]|nr:PQQ-dependent sugar dehydrogenase [Pseudomonadota bacterium]